MITNSRLNKNITTWGKVIFAAFTYAVAVEIFLSPSTVVVGGATGIASIIDIFVGANIWSSTGVFVALINIPIIVYCYLQYSTRFATKTMVYVLLLTTFLLVMRVFDLGDKFHHLLGNNEEGNKMIYTLVGGALSGVSLPLMLSIGGSTGGSDIAGLILQKRNKSSSTDSIRAIFFANIVILLLGAIVMFLVKDAEHAINLFVYSMAGIVVNEIVHERMYRGFSSAIELEITTCKQKEMADALLEELKHGVTYIKAVGGYTGKEQTVVLCVVYKHQLTKARRIISRVDPQAFAYVENVREVIGTGFVNKEDHLTEE